MSTIENKKVFFPGVQDGGTFKIGDMEFIKFPSIIGQTPVVMKDVAFRSQFGGTNDLRSSDVLRKMEAKILPKIIEAVGEENVLTFKTNLTTLDGLKSYDAMESRISLPTLDFYRTHVDILDKFKLDDWWWLATPESAQPHDVPNWILCVSPSGGISFNLYNIDGCGVRPFLIFNSSIFGYPEAEQ